MALAAWSLGLGARTMGQDPVDAWRLELDLRTESLPVLGNQVEL